MLGITMLMGRKSSVEGFEGIYKAGDFLSFRKALEDILLSIRLLEILLNSVNLL